MTGCFLDSLSGGHFIVRGTPIVTSPGSVVVNLGNAVEVSNDLLVNASASAGGWFGSARGRTREGL